MKKVFKYILIVALIIGIWAFAVNFYVTMSTKKDIMSVDELSNLSNVDCIIVLGAGVWGDEPSPMLEDRLLKGKELYENGISKKIIVSGDHGKKDYNEVGVMKKYLINNGIPSEDIFMDHAGFSTYDSIYRLKEIFEAKKVVIVTQKYHLYRAVYISKKLNLEAYGVAANPRKYAGRVFREIREVIARNKDFLKTIIKPSSKYLGEKINLNDDGNITND